LIPISRKTTDLVDITKAQGESRVPSDTSDDDLWLILIPVEGTTLDYLIRFATLPTEAIELKRIVRPVNHKPVPICRILGY